MLTYLGFIQWSLLCPMHAKVSLWAHHRLKSWQRRYQVMLGRTLYIDGAKGRSITVSSTTTNLGQWKSRWCATCRRWWHRRLSLWQPSEPLMTTKFALWKSSLFSNPISCEPRDHSTYGPSQWTNWLNQYTEWSLELRPYTVYRILYAPGFVVVCFAVVILHDDVTTRKLFPRCWPFVRGIHRSRVNSPHKGQWRGALIFS